MTASNPTEGLPDEPRDDVVRYVLGEMTLDEQIAFELRMAEDDALARTVTAAMAIDEQLGLAARRAVAAPPRRRAARFAVAATIGLAVGAATWLWWTQRPVAHEVAVAVVPTATRFEQLVTELGMTDADAPVEAMRGDGPVRPDGAARVDALLQRADEQLQRAIAAPAAEVQGEAFVVPLTNRHPVWVAVVGAFEDGSGRVYFPDAADVDATRREGRLPPGTHVLPAPRATASAEQRERGVVAFAPGFVVPRQRDRVTVLVLTMPSAPSASTWQLVRERIARSGGDLRRDLVALVPDAACSAFVVRAR